jgi:hypothetical protein
MSPEQEDQVCDALAHLGWLENDHALHAEGVRVVMEQLSCSLEDAKSMLRDLRARKCIDVTTSPGNEHDAGKPMPLGTIRWVRPPTS